jgi:hypothetical protein
MDVTVARENEMNDRTDINGLKKPRIREVKITQEKINAVIKRAVESEETWVKWNVPSIPKDPGPMYD